MNENLYKVTKAHSRKVRIVCTRPAVRGLLYDYIADLLEDPAAEEFEDHLLDCRICREEYLKILSLRSVTGGTKTEYDGEDKRERADAKVLSFAEFRKELP